MKIESFETFLILHSDYQFYKSGTLGHFFLTTNGIKWLICNSRSELQLYCMPTAQIISSKTNIIETDSKDKKEVHALLMQYLENMKDENWLI